MPASNSALLLVFKTLFLIQESILTVDLARNNNPSPGDDMRLMDLKSDLETVKDELVAMRDALQAGTQSIPTPSAEDMKHVRDLISAVETAKNQGAAAGAVLAVVDDALTTGMTVLSLAA